MFGSNREQMVSRFARSKAVRDALYLIRRWHKLNMLQVDRSMVRIRRTVYSQVAITGVIDPRYRASHPGKRQEKGGG